MIIQKKTNMNKNKFRTKDKVLVNYDSPYYDIHDVPGIVSKVHREEGFTYLVSLVDENGNPINRGHNLKEGEPGSGNWIYVDDEHLTLVEKYEPKVLKGVTKKTWKVGDKFKPREGFSKDAAELEDPCVTGVEPKMVNNKDEIFEVIGIMNHTGSTLLLENVTNYFWRTDWVDPVD